MTRILQVNQTKSIDDLTKQLNQVLRQVSQQLAVKSATSGSGGLSESRVREIARQESSGSRVSLTDYAFLPGRSGGQILQGGANSADSLELRSNSVNQWTGNIVFGSDVKNLWINVKDRGAVGDGVTDDTTAIQGCINDASASSKRGIVYFPPGVYVVSTLDMTGKPVTLKGNSSGGTIIKGDGSGHVLQSINTSAIIGVVLEDLAFSSLVIGQDPPVLAGAGAGNVDNGTHYYIVSYVKNGVERGFSIPYGVTVADKTVNGKVNLSFTVGPAGTTSRKIYRTVAGGRVWKLLTTIADNVSLTYQDNTADTGLGAVMPGSGFDCVYFENVQMWAIERCQFSFCRNGINLALVCSIGTVHSCTFGNNCDGAGIRVGETTEYIRIAENWFDENLGDGIRFHNAFRCTVANNHFVNNVGNQIVDDSVASNNARHVIANNIFVSGSGGYKGDTALYIFSSGSFFYNNYIDTHTHDVLVSGNNNRFVQNYEANPPTISDTGTGNTFLNMEAGNDFKIGLDTELKRTGTRTLSLKSTNLYVDGPPNSPSSGAQFGWTNAGNIRWLAYISSTETGSNAGSDLYFPRYDDAGNFLGNCLYLQRSSGRIGVKNNTSPTANLHISAGTSTASGAPFKIDAGTLLTTPETGSIEFDGTDFWVTNSTLTRNKIALPTGTSGQTLRSDGTNWLANSILTNDGTTITAAGIFRVTGGAVGASVNTNAQWVGGQGSPVSGRIFIGDGTGWSLKWAKRAVSVTTDLLSIDDNAVLDIGTAGAIFGKLRLEGSTSGYAQLQSTAIAGNAILTLPAITGTVALLQNNLGDFAATTSAQLAGVLSDETGTGSAVFATNPTLNGLISTDIIEMRHAPQGGGLKWTNAGSIRWLAYLSGTETGLNAGSDLYFPRYNDAGIYLGDCLLLQRSSGRVGIKGITNPTANLHVSGGTSTASGAPLKIDSGTLLSSPEPGAVEYDGAGLFFSPSTTRLRTVLTDSSVPANGMLAIGNGVNYTNATLTGTVNQITVTNGAGTITLSTPQGIGTTSTPQFAALGIGGPAVAGEVVLEQKALVWQKAAVDRWSWGMSGTETGGNAGSNIVFSAYSDTGAFLSSPITITRSSGDVTFANIVTVNRDVVITGTNRTNPFQIGKTVSAAAGPGAAVLSLRVEAGTNAGTLKLVAYAGTSATGATVIDNVGSGN